MDGTTNANSTALNPVAGFGDFGASALATSLILGNLLNWGLLGTLSVQVYTYYIAFPTDKRIVQSIVYFILATQFAQTLLSTRDAFSKFSINIGNILVLDDVQMLWLSYPLMGGLVALIYHSFSVHRIYKCTGNKAIAAMVAILALLGFGAAITSCVRMKLLKKISQSVLDVHNFIAYGIWNLASATCDVVITIIMVYDLVRHTKDDERTILLINKIIRFTVGTGMTTAAAAITSAVLFVGFRHIPTSCAYFLLPGISLGKLYGITLLTALNSRLEVVGGRHNSTRGNQVDTIQISVQPDFFLQRAKRRKLRMRWPRFSLRSDSEKEKRRASAGSGSIMVETHRYVHSDRSLVDVGVSREMER